MARFDVSVIIVNWNGRDVLGPCVHSVFDAVKGIACEVILVDNASEDGSAEKAKEQFPEVVLLRNRTNEGFARACNAGIRASQGRMILLLNSDTVVRDDAIRRMSAFMDEHPEAGIAGCRLLNRDETLQKSAGKVRNVLHELEEKLIRFGLRKGIRPICRHEERFASRVQSVDWVSGAFLMIKRSVIDGIGLLDERLFLFFEDIEWCARARDAGWSVMYNPEVSVLHSGGKSVSKMEVRAALEYRRSQMIFYKTRYGRGPNTQVLKLYLLLLSLVGIAANDIARLGKGPARQHDLAAIRQMYKQLFKLVQET